MAGDLSLISIPPAETTGYIGSPMLVSVGARSESGKNIEYQWKKDGKVLDGETKNTLIVKDMKAKDAGVYSVDVKADKEILTAQSKVVFSKTKLPKARKPAAAPQAASCHDPGPAAPKKHDKHEHHHHH